METARRRSAAKPLNRRAPTDLQSILDSTGEGIYGIDRGGSCTFANRAASEMLGYAPDELLGRNMHELIHYNRPNGSAYSEDDCPIFKAARSGKATRSEDDVLWRKNGTSFA